jgi:hypothetical protein
METEQKLFPKNRHDGTKSGMDFLKKMSFLTDTIYNLYLI